MSAKETIKGAKEVIKNLEIGYGYYAVETNSNMYSPAFLAIVSGDYLPSHDQVYDAALVIGRELDKLHEYITSARSAEQADRAIVELLTGLLFENEMDS